MGIPVIDAPEEADSQCACLTKSDIAYGVGSEDMDILTFGSKKLLRNISSSKKNDIVEYDLSKILEELKYSYQEFIDLCILLGCDYVEAIPGITPNDAYNIIKKHRSIVNFLKSDDSIKYKFPENYRKDCIAASSYFLECPHKPVISDQLKLGIYDINKIKDLLIKKYSYSRTKVDKIISKISNESFEKKYDSSFFQKTKYDIRFYNKSNYTVNVDLPNKTYMNYNNYIKTIDHGDLSNKTYKIFNWYKKVYSNL